MSHLFRSDTVVGMLTLRWRSQRDAFISDKATQKKNCFVVIFFVYTLNDSERSVLNMNYEVPTDIQTIHTIHTSWMTRLFNDMTKSYDDLTLLCFFV